MKRLVSPLAVAIVALLPLSAPLGAQRSTPSAIDRGSLIIDGSASLSRSSSTTGNSESDAKVTSTQVSLVPSLLYFIAPRFAVGGSLELSHFKAGAASQNVVGGGPAVRLYFAGASATALPYVGSSARIARHSLDVDDVSGVSVTQWDVEGVAGMTFLFSRQVGIVTEAYARRSSFSNGGAVGAGADIKRTEFGLRLGVAAFVPKHR